MAWPLLRLSLLKFLFFLKGSPWTEVPLFFGSLSLLQLAPVFLCEDSTRSWEWPLSSARLSGFAGGPSLYLEHGLGLGSSAVEPVLLLDLAGGQLLLLGPVVC